MRKFRAPAALLAASSFALSGPAAADPAVFDSESDVIAALSSTFFVATGASDTANILVNRSRDVARRSLALLHSATTPAALAAAPAGMEFPCPNGGTMSARLKPTPPRTLTLGFAACAFHEYSTVWELTGPAEVKLSSASFTPQSVAGIRLGTVDTDFVNRLLVPETLSQFQAENFNLRVDGRIVVYAPPDTDYYSAFEYRLTGFFISDNGHQRDEYVADGINMRGERTFREYDDLVTYDYRYRYEGGTLSHEMTEFWSETTLKRTLAFGDLRTRFYQTARLSNDDATTTVDIDGDLDISMPDSEQHTGCPRGEYRFRTVRPLFVAEANYTPTQVVDGDVTINDSVTAVFTAFPRPTAHVFARGLGYFRYHDPIGGIPSESPCAW
jgi:hypothetical protein